MKTYHQFHQLHRQSHNTDLTRAQQAAASEDTGAGARAQAARSWAQPFNLGRTTEAWRLCAFAATAANRTQKDKQRPKAEKGGTCLSAPL